MNLTKFKRTWFAVQALFSYNENASSTTDPHNQRIKKQGVLSGQDLLETWYVTHQWVLCYVEQQKWLELIRFECIFFIWAGLEWKQSTYERGSNESILKHLPHNIGIFEWWGERTIQIADLVKKQSTPLMVFNCFIQIPFLLHSPFSKAKQEQKQSSNRQGQWGWVNLTGIVY